MDEEALKAQARELAGRLIALADDIEEFKHKYDWYTWVINGDTPITAIDAGVQNLDGVETDIHTTRRDALYGLAYATE